MAQEITSSAKIVTVLSKMTDVLHYDKVTYVQRYCDPNWTGKKTSLSSDGPILPIIMVPLDVYTVEASNIKKDFLAQPQSSVVHPSFNALTIQHPGKLG